MEFLKDTNLDENSVIKGLKILDFICFKNANYVILPHYEMICAVELQLSPCILRIDDLGPRLHKQSSK